MCIRDRRYVGKNGTIFIPTYNWDFCKGKTFHYKKTRSQSGSLGNIALKRKDLGEDFLNYLKKLPLFSNKRTQIRG